MIFYDEKPEPKQKDAIHEYNNGLNFTINDANVTPKPWNDKQVDNGCFGTEIIFEKSTKYDDEKNLKWGDS